MSDDSKLKKFGGMGQLTLKENIKSPMHVGSHSIAPKMAPQKHMPGPDAKPSQFFKNEGHNIRHPSIRKLYDFLSHRKMKKCSP